MENKQEITDQFLDQIRNGEEFKDFMKDLFKRGVEKILQGEITDHLDRNKHVSSQDGNYRNGYIKKHLKTENGEISISVPRDRDGTFEPLLVPKKEVICLKG